MEYEQFRSIWHEALAQADLMSAPPQKPSEMMDLVGLSRTYQINVALGQRQPVNSFYISARLEWQWDALQASPALAANRCHPARQPTIRLAHSPACPGSLATLDGRGS